MPLRRRSYLVEMGKSFDIARPTMKNPDGSPKKMKMAGWKRELESYRGNLKQAVDKVLTWSKNKGRPNVQWSTIRIESPTGKTDFFVDMSMDAFDEKSGFHVAMFERGKYSSTLNRVGKFKSIRAARKAAREAVVKKAHELGATRLVRISTNTKVGR